MLVGASTSCFYPLETEKALIEVANAGFNQAEVFFNAPQEMEEPFVNKIKKISLERKVDIVSVHPFSSFLESSCIFGDYQRRFDDFIGFYEKTCHATAMLGAKYVVIHGAVAKPKIPIPDERYFERFKTLVDIGKKEGVIVCQENVNRFKSESIDFCKKMREALKDDFNMVFDVKQTVRANQDTFLFLNEFKNEIRHVHFSDNSKEKDCQPPGRGNFDFKKVYDVLGDKATYIIEIYSSGYDIENELIKSREYLSEL